MNSQGDVDNARSKRRITGLIILGLLIWSGLITWGVVRNQPVFDIRKPLVFLVVMTGFVVIWVGLLNRRNRR